MEEEIKYKAELNLINQADVKRVGLLAVLL
jgi:hypothetical protein